MLEPSYYAYQEYYTLEEGEVDSDGFYTTIDSVDYSRISKGDTELMTDLEGPFEEAIALIEQGGLVEYTVTVPESGYYQIGVDYYTLPGKRASAVQSLRVNGEYPFYQTRQLTFQ